MHSWRWRCGGYNTLARSAMAFVRALGAYHEAIKADDSGLVDAARVALKKARRRYIRATQWGVNYDQPS